MAENRFADVGGRDGILLRRGYAARDEEVAALRKRVQELDAAVVSENGTRRHAEGVAKKMVDHVDLLCESERFLCTAADRAALDVLKRRRIVVCPRCNGRGSGPGPCRAICQQCQGECLCVDDGKPDA